MAEVSSYPVVEFDFKVIHSTPTRQAKARAQFARENCR